MSPNPRDAFCWVAFRRAAAPAPLETPIRVLVTPFPSAIVLPPATCAVPFDFRTNGARFVGTAHLRAAPGNQVRLGSRRMANGKDGRASTQTARDTARPNLCSDGFLYGCLGPGRQVSLTY